MKTYVITLSQVFPVKHPRKGAPTYFKEKMANAIYHMRHPEVFEPGEPNNEDEKYHTIRANYKLWAKRFAKINTGQACLSVRVWSGKPYASQQIEIARLTKDDGIGLQALEFLEFDPAFKPGIWIAGKTYSQSQKLILAKNDGLSFDDWNAWFFGDKNYDFRKTLAIIHFTKFRY